VCIVEWRSRAEFFNCWKAVAHLQAYRLGFQLYVPDLTGNIDMKRLVTLFLLLAVGIVSTASNVSTGEMQSDLDATGLNISFRGMKSADWNGDAMEDPLANATGRSLENLLEVFNPRRLARRWKYPYDNLTNGCGAHMDQYLTHLDKGVLWALKSEYYKISGYLEEVCVCVCVFSPAPTCLIANLTQWSAII
jgi:hypothetical protein